MLAHLLILGSLLVPKPDSTAPKVLNAVRVDAGQAPTVDGHLNEAIWATAAAGTDFVQFGPKPGAPASERTEVRVAYDETAIYVAARMFDSQPDSVVGQLSRRDQASFSDQIIVGFDSRNDRQTAYVFGLNPRGVKLDLFLYENGNGDDGWNAVWDGAAQTDSLGWTAEFRIPLSQLRYSPRQGPQSWGFEVQRKIARRGEESFWAPILPSDGAVVSRFGTLTGLSDLRTPERLELQPYSVARMTRAPADSGNPFYESNDGYASFGMDVKYGVTSNLTLSATVNPDFGQVEADPSQVNLSAYETFFREQRPFFVEGADIFRFGLGAGDDDSESLFYSRRVGRQPQGSVPGEARYADAPQATRILAAAKLSGKTVGGWSVGLLNAVTAEEHARFVLEDGTRDDAVVEPLANYTVGRVVRDFREGQSAVGLIGTAVARRLPDDGRLADLRSSAFAGGVDARHRFGGGKYQIRGYVLGSNIQGDSLAILRAQRSSVRYFQRPDADHLGVDSTLTSLSGWAALGEFVKIGGGNWRYGGFMSARSPGFETNDIGYLRETGYGIQAAFLSYQQPDAGKHFRNWNVNLNQHLGYSFGREMVAAGVNVNGSAQLANFWRMYGGIRRNLPNWSTDALRGGPAIREPGLIGGWFGGTTDSRKPLALELEGSWSREDESGGYSFGLSPEIEARPSGRSSLEVGPSFEWRRGAWQYVATSTADAADPRYIFADIDQTTVALTARFAYTFSPNLSLQLYGQPFVSSGSYSDFKEVLNPRAGGFRDRFGPLADAELDEMGIGRPDFNYKAFRSNAVLRWEYRPGSSLFVVWSQGRDHFAEDGTFEAGRDFRRLFDPAFAPSTNVLLVKFSYWFNI